VGGEKKATPSVRNRRGRVRCSLLYWLRKDALSRAFKEQGDAETAHVLRCEPRLCAEAPTDAGRSGHAVAQHLLQRAEVQRDAHRPAVGG